MKTNIGIFREEEMILELNNTKVKDLSRNLYHLCQDLFGHLNDEDIVYCAHIDGFIKPDFSIRINDEVHYVSMKSGSSNVVHGENIDKFVTFLHEKGISERTIETVLLYHYSDNTIDGTGTERYTYEEIMVSMKKRIIEANNELNLNKQFVLDLVNRVMFQGTFKENMPADCIYHGDTEFGIVTTKKQILKHIIRRSYDWMHNLHIGPIQFNPHSRYVGKEITDPEKRKMINFYWPNLKADMEYISSRYNG